MLEWGARHENVRRYRLHAMLGWAARHENVRRYRLHAILKWAARHEDKHNYHRALYGYRFAAEYGYNHVDEQVTATDSIHRVLQELAHHDPATPKWELSRARAEAAKAVLERARRSRRRGELAEAKRDLQALIDKPPGRTAGEAAHELAEMIDDARGNPREDRFPPEPPPPWSPPLGQTSELTDKYRELGKDPVRILSEVPKPKVRSDPRKDLRALGYATESDALTDAIALCRTAIRLGTKVWRKGPSALLAQLLDDYGDPAAAAVARAHLDIPDMLRAADDQDLCEYYRTTDSWEARQIDIHRNTERDSADYSPPDSGGFASLVVEHLRPTETAHNIRHSALRQPRDPESIRRGFLVLTNERLLFLQPEPSDGPQLAFERQGSLGREPDDEELLAIKRLLALQAGELLVIDRTSIISIRPTQQDERGRTWLEIRFPPSAGTAAHEGEASVRVGQIPDVWLMALAPKFAD